MSTPTKPRTATWAPGLAGILLAVVGIMVFADGSTGQLTFVVAGTVLLVGSAVWAVRERSYQAAVIWAVGAALGVLGVIVTTT
ncbi:hypothetical protein [Rhodococcus sp. NPDC076796]|uniref:hypothetical protein n=1 Tax=Rhodococcus sp. NPDC076796 TaxID=3154859 RepID=UPI00344CF8A5